MPITANMLGWRRDPPDPRDLHYSLTLKSLNELPEKAEVVLDFPVYDQGPIGSCTANALAAAVAYERRHDGLTPDFKPSVLFIYYNERVRERTVASDAGAYLRSGVKVLSKLGVCHEEAWPDDHKPADDEGRFPPDARAGQRPAAECFEEALTHQLLRYRRVPQLLRHMQGVIAEGHPFVFGFAVFSGLMSMDPLPTIIPLPSAGERVVGGHAIICVGYDNATQLFKVRNSWGPNVGEAGCFYMPYAYLLDRDLAADFWVVDTFKG